jgi:hypothetical protein
MNEITATRSRVVMSRDALHALTGRLQAFRRLSERLRESLNEEHQLLLLALHQLAHERGIKDRQTFARRWQREHRRQVSMK